MDLRQQPLRPLAPRPNPQQQASSRLPGDDPQFQSQSHTRQRPEPSRLESFPHPSGQPAQQALQQRLQQHPYHTTTSKREHSIPARDLFSPFYSSNFAENIPNVDMAPSTTPVPKHLNFITGNKNKLAEVQAILDGVIELRSQNVDLVEIQGTVEQVTTDKCRRAAEAINGPVLVEDTCLCFKAMNDLPGPYIKWFMLALGPQNLHKMLDSFEDKSAQAVCTFAYCEGPGHEPVLFQGRTDGKLVASRGPMEGGWDSCFEYEGQTYAEMEKSEKNKISHRGKALDKLKEWLASHVEA